MQLSEFKLEEFWAKHEFSAPYLFASSDAQTLTLKELLSLADRQTLALWNDLSLGYTETRGLPLLRQEIAGLYETISADNVLVCSGAEEGIYTLMQVIVEPRSHVVVITPCYQSLTALPTFLGAEVTEIPLRLADGWQLDMQQLTEAVRPNTRLIVVNFPHNPTSYQPDHATFAKIVELARKAGAYLFSDEVYRYAEHEPRYRLPSASDCYEKGISLGVMSKSLGLAGLRIGWLASADKQLLRKAASFKNYLTICNSAPSELLALIALRAREQILAKNLAVINNNLDLLDKFFARFNHRFVWKRPIAGTTAFVELRHALGIEQFTQQLLASEGVLILPGLVYDYPGDFFRIGFARANMPEVLLRFERFVGTL